MNRLGFDDKVRDPRAPYLRLRIPQSGEKRVDFLHSEREVGVGVQTEYFRRVDLGEGLDVILESSQLLGAVVICNVIRSRGR